MVSMKKRSAWLLSMAIILWLTGCGTTKPVADSWSLPKKDGTDSGMIIGRLDFPVNKTENPEQLVLNLENIEFWNVTQVVRFGNAGVPDHIMANNYFVVPNLKPGTYQFSSFRVGNTFHGLHAEKGFTYEVKPGEIKFIGSLDYIQYDQSLLQKLGKKFNFNVKKAQKPTELEMLQWLNKTSTGSGWEPVIKKRMLELGGRP
jgi:hypothetical protein